MSISANQLILASGSPRRRELLHYIKEDYLVETSDAEESASLPADLAPEEIPMYLARVKAMDVARRHPGSTVIGADTVVISPDGEILGKPRDQTDAALMLRELSGKTHQVVTGVCLCSAGENGQIREHLFNEITDVTFYPLSEEEIEAYVRTGEPLDKAGAYGIQGYGSLLAQGIRGDFFNVVGLPLARLNRELRIFIGETVNLKEVSSHEQ